MVAVVWGDLNPRDRGLRRGGGYQGANQAKERVIGLKHEGTSYYTRTPFVTQESLKHPPSVRAQEIEGKKFDLVAAKPQRGQALPPRPPRTDKAQRPAPRRAFPAWMRTCHPGGTVNHWWGTVRVLAAEAADAHNSYVWALLK